MIRHVLAPAVPSAARSLGVPLALPSLAGAVLSFDDGPHPAGTPAVMEVLAAAGAPAMFFLIGEQVARRPSLAAELLAAGHTVALHGHRHRLQLRLSAAQVADDLRRGAAAIEDATGAGVSWHRPPYGVYSAAGLAGARAAGLQPLLWSRWGKDWRRFTSPARIAARATTAVARGDVILLHDADFYSAKRSHERTAQALPLIVSELARREIATVLPV
jgi:peptidoglycan/xylan/chitin deacetylase (PgdA/CDA1 family)